MRQTSNSKVRRCLLAIGLAWFGAELQAGEAPRPAVPKSPFIGVVYRYADTLLEHGRDDLGRTHTGMFLSALDRATLRPLTNRPAAPAGIREGDRVGRPGAPLTGANPQHDENLLRLLYSLSELSGQPKYRAAADGALKWFLEHAASDQTHLLAWGEHLSWDVERDEPIAAQSAGIGDHEFFRPWVLWDRCFELSPEASRAFAVGLWEHQIADRQTGAFNRHAGYWKHAATDGMDFARHAGFYIRTWAVAYAHTGGPEFLKAIEVLLGRFEQKRDPQTGLIELRSGEAAASPPLSLSLAIDCDGAADRVPETLATRLRAFAGREDEVFCGLPHAVESRDGLITSVDKMSGKPLGWSPLWEGRYGGLTTAQIGMMCVARYERTGKVGYRSLLTNAANAYLRANPRAGVDVWPMTMGHVISLELAAWRHTARQEYFERARELGNLAVEKFWQDNPLPAASVNSRHYESITGADTLALALMELHLQILHITAVASPPNTVDR